MFICRLCGCDSYMNDNQSFGYICERCSVKFDNPRLFKLPEVLVKLEDGVELPERTNFDDSGYDVKSTVDVTIDVGDTVMIPTGISVDLPDFTEIQVRPRSGMAKKYGITVANSPGTIDAGYKGPCNVLLRNGGKEPYQVSKGDRIAQFVITTKMPYRLKETNTLSDSDRGATGFGDSGK